MSITVTLIVDSGAPNPTVSMTSNDEQILQTKLQGVTPWGLPAPTPPILDYRGVQANNPDDNPAYLPISVLAFKGVLTIVGVDYPAVLYNDLNGVEAFLWSLFD